MHEGMLKIIRWITFAVGEAENESDSSCQFGKDDRPRVFGCAFLLFRDIVMQARYLLRSEFASWDTFFSNHFHPSTNMG